MNEPAPPATWSIAELHDAVGGLLEHVFGATVWVSGELRSLHRTSAGHSYFELVDPGVGEDHGAARLSVTLFNGYRQKVNNTIRRAGGGIRMEDGTTVRVCGELKTYPAQSRLQLVMTGIDPTYTLGVALQRRELALAALAADGLLGRNGELPLPHPALHVALVTSRGSAAEADVLHELERSGIGFHVHSVDARTQGTQAEGSIVAALAATVGLGVDVVLLVRGGGSRTDLAVFDSEVLARAIATLGTPVLTGIGHETDRSVADEVAHSAYKTPTAAAGALVESALGGRRDVDTAAAAVVAAADDRLRRAADDLAQAMRTAGVAARGHLGRETAMVEQRAGRTAAATIGAVQRADGRVRASSQLLGAGSGRALDRTARRLDHLGALVEARDPAHTLAAGWSITRTAGGRLVRSTAEVSGGAALVTTVADGSIASVADEPGTGVPEEHSP